MFLSNQKITLEQSLLAIIADNLQFLAWTKTKDAEKGYNRPESILDALRHAGEKDDSEIVAFDDLESFELARQKIIMDRR